MSDEPLDPPGRGRHAWLLGGGLLIAALGGALVMRMLTPHPQSTQAPRPTRPIVQIVREQPGLPDLADLVDRLCPSVAVIVQQGVDVPVAPPGSPAVNAYAISADGWLVTKAADLPAAPMDAIFGDGRRAQLTDERTDPVSGLAIVKATATATPLTFSDQAFPRVGQFGLGLTTPAGTGCSAVSAMIGSDFLADGGAPLGYVRLQPAPLDWSAGMPLVGSDGRVLGIGADDPAGAVIPSPIASVILDELLRGSLSPSTGFGFRAIDYSAPFSSRLGNVRSGAGVALVQPKSPADKAGLRAGDIITSVNDDPVSSASELGRALDALTGKAKLLVQRQSQQLTLTIARTGSH